MYIKFVLYGFMEEIIIQNFHPKYHIYKNAEDLPLFSFIPLQNLSFLS